MKKLLFTLIFLSSYTYAQKSISAEEIISSVLKTPDGKIFRMYETRKYAASVFVFLLPDCPACENYTLTLNKMAEKYASAGIQFYGVFPPFITSAEIEKFRSDYHITFPLLMDYNRELLHAF